LPSSNKVLGPVDTVSASDPALESKPFGPNGDSSRTGALIVNADDWGQDVETTDRILECVLLGAVSSASAMVFMEDSERAARVALQEGVDTGLHLNLTTKLSAPGCGAKLLEHHQRVAEYLLSHSFAQVVFNPLLRNSFEYVVAAQIDEFERLHGARPARVDGHHHMHLCVNVLFENLLPAGTIARRHFSFQHGEKSLFNRLYRKFSDGILLKKHRVADYFYSLVPLEPQQRLQKAFSDARNFVVEVETHPVNTDEYDFLTKGEIFRLTKDVPIAARFALPSPAQR
jgi:chitin disaccharide deacetylase